MHHVFRPDDTRQVLEVGALLPAHASALGKMLLAHHSYAAAECIKAGLLRYTPGTIVDAQEFGRELESIRERGWAAELEELVSDEAAYAAPIKDRRGETVGSIGIRGPAERLCVKGKPRAISRHQSEKQPVRSHASSARSPGKVARPVMQAVSDVLAALLPGSACYGGSSQLRLNQTGSSVQPAPRRAANRPSTQPRRGTRLWDRRSTRSARP